MTGVLPDYLAIYDSCSAIYSVWMALLIIAGAPALAAILASEARNLRAALSYDAQESWAGYISHRETVCARLVRYTSAVNGASVAASTPVLVACAALAVSSPTLVPVEPRTVETIGQGCEGSAPVALDSLRPTRIIPCVVRGVCRYRDAATGRFVRFDATNTPV